MKRFRLFAAGLTLGLSAGAVSLAASATPAVAAAPATVAQHAAGEVALPAASAICGINSGFFTAWHSGCTNPWKLACTEGNSGTIPFDPVSTSNGCSTRVWIYQEAVRAGYNLCLNPDSSTGALDKAYTYVWISGNAEDC